MSRAAPLCCTAAALFSVGAAHAQQGNLPTPVQKLPSYPPVVCVAPNWRPEPCEGRHDIRQVMEEDRAQPALPLLNSRNTPRAFECIKPAEPGWLGLGGLFQLLDCTWFGWIEPYPVKPFDGKWPASQLAEPVKCLKPDGTEEPCESRDTAQPLTPEERLRPAHGAENDPKPDRDWVDSMMFGIFDGKAPSTLVIRKEYGGRIDWHNGLYKWLENTHIIVDGECDSSCTMVLGNRDVCATDRGFFYFHAARILETGLPSPNGTAKLMATYPKKVKDWIASKGGLTTEWLGVHAQKFLPKCEEAKIP